MRGIRRSAWACRIGSAVLALALATPTTALASLGPSNTEVEKLYTEGQDRAEAKDYTGAADSWTRLLNLLDESPDTQAIRESVIINVLEAHINAYNLLVDENGNKDVSHLRKGKATLEDYYASYKEVHGERVAVSAAVQQKAEELESALKKAEEDAIKRKQAEESGGEDGNGDEDPRPINNNGQDDGGKTVLVSQNNGNGLLIGGSVVTALGIGALVMVPVGSVRGNRAEEDYNDAQARLDVDPNDAQATTDRERAEFDGQQANAILIAGAVLFPLLLAGGITMIVFGAKQKRRSQRGAANLQLTPSLGRRSAGFSLSGKF